MKTVAIIKDDQQFYLSKEDEVEALSKLINYVQNLEEGGWWLVDDFNNIEFLNAHSLEGFFDPIGIEVIRDEHGGVIGFNDRLSYWEQEVFEVLLRTIAEYVDDDSFIEVSIDAKDYRYTFKQGKLNILNPSVTWG